MAPLSFCSRNLFSLFHKPSVIPFEFWGQHSSALFSTHIVGDTPIIVRDFIHKALYDPNVGYFSQKSASVGVLDRSIKFNQLQGRKAYMKHLDKIYKQSDVSWFTPVELFKPWYAHGIAEAILRTTNLSVPLKIYEIGGGSGTCAKGILDYIKLNAPTRVYDNISYTSVEISSSLAAKQIQTVGEVDSHLSKFRVECRDAADRSGWGDVNEQPCWVIMLEFMKLNHDERNWVVGEKLTPLKMPITNIWHASNEHFTILQEHNVLDNLPHDLIYSENQMSPWMEVWVESKQGEKLSELYRPIQDSLIKSCMEIIDLPNATTGGSRVSSAMKSIWAKVFPKPRWCWLPTGCLKLLEVLHGALPKMSLIASDFSYLPDVKIPGERAPLVSTKKDGSSSDYNSYLDAKGDADIFFPTDFLLLEQIDHYCSGWMKQQKDDTSLKRGKKRRTLSLDTAAFMEEFGLPTKTRTKDGYNPLLDDFKNTKFYLSVPTHNIK